MSWCFVPVPSTIPTIRDSAARKSYSVMWSYSIPMLLLWYELCIARSCQGMRIGGMTSPCYRSDALIVIAVVLLVLRLVGSLGFFGSTILSLYYPRWLIRVWAVSIRLTEVQAMLVATGELPLILFVIHSVIKNGCLAYWFLLIYFLIILLFIFKLHYLKLNFGT